MQTPVQGSLDLVLGPMCSGKTEGLIALYQERVRRGISVVAITHELDMRDCRSGAKADACRIQSAHASDSNAVVPALRGTSLLRLADEESVVKCSAVLVDEGQFFADLVPAVSRMVNRGQHVTVFGLDGDFRRQRFGTVLDLVPLCDSVVKKTSRCGLCGTGAAAPFTHRVNGGKAQVLVGREEYTPACRLCFDGMNAMEDA